MEHAPPFSEWRAQPLLMQKTAVQNGSEIQKKGVKFRSAAPEVLLQLLLKLLEHLELQIEI